MTWNALLRLVGYYFSLGGDVNRQDYSPFLGGGVGCFVRFFDFYDINKYLANLVSVPFLGSETLSVIASPSCCPCFSFSKRLRLKKRLISASPAQKSPVYPNHHILSKEPTESLSVNSQKPGRNTWFYKLPHSGANQKFSPCSWNFFCLSRDSVYREAGYLSEVPW